MSALQIHQGGPDSPGALSLWAEHSQRADGSVLLDIMLDGSPSAARALVITNEQRLKLIDYLSGDGRGDDLAEGHGEPMVDLRRCDASCCAEPDVVGR